MKKFLTTILALTLLLTLGGCQKINTPPTTETEEPGTLYYSDWPVINNETVGNLSNEEVEASVRERIEELKGQKVLCYVFIMFPDIDAELYQPTDTNKEELERLSSEINRYDEQLDELRAEYAKTGDQNTKNRLDALLDERNEMFGVWFDLKIVDRKLFHDEMMEKEIEEITGQKIELPLDEPANDICMYLPPEIIEKFLDNDDYFICFVKEETDDFPQDDELVCRDE